MIKYHETLTPIVTLECVVIAVKKQKEKSDFENAHFSILNNIFILI